MFKAALKYIKAVFEDHMLEEHRAGWGCAWQFNIKCAPWWEGAFERFIKSTKCCLRRVIVRAHFSFDKLLNAITEIEAVINQDPCPLSQEGTLTSP